MENIVQNLTEFVKEQGGRVQASKASFYEIEKLLRGTEADRSNGRLEKGKMYIFRYFTPKEKQYDSFPVVIGLGLSDDEHQLGINLHYIPYDSRLTFVQTFLDSYGGSLRESTIGSKAFNAGKQSPITTLDYNQIKRAFGRKFNLTYAIRQYSLKRMRKPISICYEKWHLGVINDENYFIGTNINEAQTNYFKANI